MRQARVLIAALAVCVVGPAAAQVKRYFETTALGVTVTTPVPFWVEGDDPFAASSVFVRESDAQAGRQVYVLDLIPAGQTKADWTRRWTLTVSHAATVTEARDNAYAFRRETRDGWRDTTCKEERRVLTRSDPSDPRPIISCPIVLEPTRTSVTSTRFRVKDLYNSWITVSYAEITDPKRLAPPDGKAGMGRALANRSGSFLFGFRMPDLSKTTAARR